MDKRILKIEVWETGGDFHVVLCGGDDEVVDVSSANDVVGVKLLVAEMMRNGLELPPVMATQMFAPPF